VRPLSKTCKRKVIFSLQEKRNRITDRATLEHVDVHTVTNLDVRMLFAYRCDVVVGFDDHQTHDGVFDLGSRDCFAQTFAITCLDKHSFGLLNNAVFHDGEEIGIERHKKESGITRSLKNLVFTRPEAED
jgi:hypothetical protein